MRRHDEREKDEKEHAIDASELGPAVEETSPSSSAISFAALRSTLACGMAHSGAVVLSGGNRRLAVASPQAQLRDFPH